MLNDLIPDSSCLQTSPKKPFPFGSSRSEKSPGVPKFFPMYLTLALLSVRRETWIRGKRRR